MDGHQWGQWHETRDSYGRRFPLIHNSFSSVPADASSAVNHQHTESASLSHYSQEATKTSSHAVIPTKSSLGPGTLSTSIPLGTSPTSSLIEPQPSESSSLPLSPSTQSNTMSTPMPSTFDTSTISPISSSVASQTSNTTALPDNNFHAHRKGLTSGQLAAAIVVPILVALLLAALAIMFLRSRSRRSGGATTTAFIPAMREVFSDFTVQKTPAAPPVSQPPPIVTSTHNNAYFTGLDTSSQGSHGQSGEVRRSEGGTFEHPPPPYKAPTSINSDDSAPETIREEPSSAVIPAHQNIPQLREPSPEPDADRPRSPFEDHEAVESMPDVLFRTTNSGRLLSPIDRPEASRSTTAHSFASTLYSENASVHDAIAARMSVGSATIVGHTPTRDLEERHRRSPFEDPTATPMSEIDNPHDWLASWMSDLSDTSDIGLAR